MEWGKFNTWKKKKLMHQYEEVLAKEDLFWRYKLREVWLEEGDNNTKFFHSSSK